MQFQKLRRISQNQRERDSAVRISEHIKCHISTDKQVICAIDNAAIFRQPRDREGLAHCSHEEANSGMLAHITDAANTYNSILTGIMDINKGCHANLQVHETCTDLHGPCK